jgi:hypothetical protein
VHQRADRQGVDDRAQADGASQQEPDDQDGDLERGADQADRPARAADQPGHQAVTGAGAELGSDVEGAGQTVEHYSGQKHCETQSEAVGGREDGEGEVADDADQDDVGDRAEAWHLAQWDPEKQNEEADDDHDRAEGQRRVQRDSGMQDVPRVQPEGGSEHHRHRPAVQDEADGELHHPTRQVRGPQLLGGAEVGEIGPGHDSMLLPIGT